jgi:hypothetical protein
MYELTIFRVTSRDSHGVLDQLHAQRCERERVLAGIDKLDLAG